MEQIALLITATNTLFLTVLLWKQTNKEQLHHEIEFNAQFEDIGQHEALKKQIKANRKKTLTSKQAPKKRGRPVGVKNGQGKKAQAKTTIRKKVNTTSNKAR